MAQALTSNATLTCPHGATISATATDNSSTMESGQPLHPTDSFTISGCPFQIPAAPSPIPSPCIQVVWVVPDVRGAIGSKTDAFDQLGRHLYRRNRAGAGQCCGSARPVPRQHELR